MFTSSTYPAALNALKSFERLAKKPFTLLAAHRKSCRATAPLNIGFLDLVHTFRD